MHLHYPKLSMEIDSNKVHTSKGRIMASKVEPESMSAKVNMHHQLEGKVNPKRKGVDMKTVEALVLLICLNKSMRMMNPHNHQWQLLFKEKKSNRNLSGQELLLHLPLIPSS